MVKCSFCGKEEHSFKGVHYVRNDGNVDYFCSSKCRKNVIKYHKDKRRVKWTEAYGIALKKTLAKEKEKKEAEKLKSGKK